MSDILAKIEAYKRAEIAEAKAARPLKALEELAKQAAPARGFVRAIERRIAGGNYAYATSAVSSSVSAYQLGPTGELTAEGVILTQPGTQAAIFPAVGVTAFPLDLQITPDNKFLYVVFSALGRVIGYKVSTDGMLTQVTSVSPYAPQVGVEGLAVY